MTGDIKKRGLGRGLDALFKDAKSEEEAFAPKIRRADEIISAGAALAPTSASSPRKIAIEKLSPGKFQPRRRFDEAALASLAESIAVHGVLQPLIVRALSHDFYEIIAGERRWRAAQKAKLHELPVVIVDIDDNAALEIALVENLQRDDLSALEEAEGYQRLMDEFHHTQDVLATRLGKSRSHVANMLRLLKLPARVKKLMEEGLLSAGHARTLIGSANAEMLAGMIVKRGLSVRQAERLVQAGEISVKKKVPIKEQLKPQGLVFKDVDILALEKNVSARLGMKVLIDSEGAEGFLTIEYKSLEQLDDVIARLSKAP